MCWVLRMGSAIAMRSLDEETAGMRPDRTAVLSRGPVELPLKPLTMKKHTDDTPAVPLGNACAEPTANKPCTVDTVTAAPVGRERLSHAERTGRAVPRGLTSCIGSWPLQEAIWRRSLALANRFRVIRTIDIAVHCFAERPFKAALSAAQRAMRGMVKARLLTRYRTNRFMTIYGLTERGAQWLDHRGVVAAASVRRVTDMTNPEHQLWAQFLTVCAEARGLKAMSEAELLQVLSERFGAGTSTAQGMLKLQTTSLGKRRPRNLRPDAVAIEADGITWFEVDRSARGSDRAASLIALVLAVGAPTALGLTLRRVVVHTLTERIKKRVLATLTRLANETAGHSLAEGRRRLVSVAEQQFQVWLTVEERISDGRVRLVDSLVGHVLVQELPVWLPRVRMDGRGGFSTEGWFTDNYLPYSRPCGMTPWPSASGLLSPLSKKFASQPGGKGSAETTPESSGSASTSLPVAGAYT